MGKNMLGNLHQYCCFLLFLFYNFKVSFVSLKFHLKNKKKKGK